MVLRMASICMSRRILLAINSVHEKDGIFCMKDRVETLLRGQLGEVNLCGDGLAFAFALDGAAAGVVVVRIAAALGLAGAGCLLGRALLGGAVLIVGVLRGGLVGVVAGALLDDAGLAGLGDLWLDVWWAG